MKNHPSTLVSGLGMAMQILQKLIDSIVKKGGHPELLYCFCSEHPLAAEMINLIAQQIVDAKWPIPRSLIERLAEEESRREYDAVTAARDKMVYWNIIDLDKKFGIPVQRFSNDNPQCPAIPSEILDQLSGKQITYPVYVTWNEVQHVIVSEDIGLEVGRVYEVGDVSHSHIYIAPADRFDMKH
jgi:hypothetical protein